ncbi:hypothetical protein KQX54_002629 [Cotesia glomerata]|uniref:WD repeat, SAM and U-box domain-containing protein 1 n=2 Tax=Cotesia glomerata TaxID=32391 RepID=A0AAV7IKD6_COTGL|nr:hypothetical protein KQX54_002629 [Cotesia glomerata]
MTEKKSVLEMESSIEDAHILQTLSVHRNDVNSVDFAADCTLVTGSGDKSVRVWKWHQGTGYEQVSWSPLMGHKYGVTCVKISPQSTMLASASIDGTTQLWNLRTGSKIHTLVQTGGEAVRVCRFAPDSTLLVTAGDNGQICLWDLIRRNLIRSLQAHEGSVQSVTFSPDSNWLLTSCTLGVLKLFSSFEMVDTSGSQSLDQSVNVFATVDDAHDLGVVCCDFSSYQVITNQGAIEKSYQLVTCGNDHDVKLWDVKVVEGKTQTQPITASIMLSKVFQRHSSALTCVRFSSNGAYIVSSGLDKIAVIWDTNTGKIVSVLRDHKRYVACCAFSRDGNLLATGSNDRSVIVWDLTGNNLTLDSKLLRRTAALIHQSSEENQDAVQEQKVVHFAENSGNDVTLISTLDDHGGAVNGVAFYGNNLLASGSGDKLVRLWTAEREEEIVDTENGEQIAHVELKFVEKPFSPIDGHKYSVNYIEFSPCGTMLASCSLDGTTMLWCTETGEQARESFVNSGTGIRVCRWSPDGTKLATAGDDEKTTLWDINTMEEIQILEGHADAITAIAFTPDSSYIVTACSEGSWRIFEIYGDSNAIAVCDAHDLGVQGCDFSPATSSPFTAVVGSRHSPTVRDDDSKSFTLATCGNDSYVKLWQIKINPKNNKDSNFCEDAEEGSYASLVSYREKRVLSGHGGNVMDVKFAPFHGEIIGSVATDRTARIWSVNSGMCLFVLEYHESLVTCCAFSGDTALFATGALDKTVALWRLPQQLISQSILIDQLRNNRKNIIDWKTEDIVKWLIEVDLGILEGRVAASRLNGRLLLTLPEEVLIARLGVFDYPDLMKIFKNQLYWLKQQDINTFNNYFEDTEVPDEYVCPITHEIMREPVKCSDGFIYEKAAINEWFLCGKYTSPMTNASLSDTSITPAIALRNAICIFLHGERSDD